MILEKVILGFNEIARPLWEDLSIWWLLFPVFLLWIASEIYSGEYRHEHLGFFSAFTNSISLLWVSAISLWVIFQNGAEPVASPILWVLMALMVYGIFILYIAFKHAFNERLVEILAAPRVVYFLSATIILFGVGNMTFSIYVILDLLVIFIIFSLFFFIMKRYFLAGLLGEVEAIKKTGGDEPR